MEIGGGDILAAWMDQMPDGTFPNFVLVSSVLSCVESLKLDSTQLEKSNLMEVI